MKGLETRMKSATKRLPPEHCMLSEFDIRPLGWLGLARSKHAASWMAFGCFLWAAGMLWLGDRLQVNAMALAVRATVQLGDHPAVEGGTQLVYGWLAGITHGPFLLLMGPLLIVMAHRFLLACGETLKEMSEAGRLRTTGANGRPWWEDMARRNRCCALPLFLFPIIIWLCLPVFQLRSIKRTGDGYPTTRRKLTLKGFGYRTDWTETGYVQSVNLAGWTNAFKAHPTAQRITAIRDLGVMRNLASALFEELDRVNQLTNRVIEPFMIYRAGKPFALRLEEAMESDVIAVTSAVVRPPFPPAKALGFAGYFREILVGRDVVLTDMSGRSEVKARKAYERWFKLFIVLTQLQIAAFFTFMAWLLFKIVFWLSQVYRMMPTGVDGDAKRKTLLFHPVLTDPSARYGLGALFRPYNLLVLVVAIGSSYGALNFPEGAGLSGITNAGGAGMGVSRVAHLVAVSVAIAGVLIGPLWLYPRRLRRWAETVRLRGLRQEMARVRKEKARKRLLEEEDTIRRQSTWPHGDQRFRLTIVIVLAVLLLPVGTEFRFLPGEITPLTHLPQVLRSACKDFAAGIYGLQKAENGE